MLALGAFGNSYQAVLIFGGETGTHMRGYIHSLFYKTTPTLAVTKKDGWL